MPTPVPRCCRGCLTASDAIPAETAEGTTTAYYSQGCPDAGIAGIYYVNTDASTSARCGRCRR